jgi:hypothetical protein
MEPVPEVFSTLPGVATGDFAGYWALGRLLATGAVHYDGPTVLALQHAIGWRGDYPNFVWYAPWSLPIFWLFGLLPYAAGLTLWLGAQMGLVFLAADRLWVHHGGQRYRRWIAALVTIAFYPTLALAIWRQSSALILFGLVAGLASLRRRRDGLAGAWFALAAIKPQLLYLGWVGLAIWIWRARRWRVAAGFVVAAALGCLAAAAINGHFFLAYLGHLANQPPSLLAGPALGALLRILVGPQHYWLQFLPAFLGLAWLAQRLGRRGVEDFAAQAPVLVLASILSGVFFWTPDLVVLSLWTIPLSVRLTAAGERRPPAGFPLAFVAITLVAAVGHELVADHWFYWLPVGYAVLFARAGRATS